MKSDFLRHFDTLEDTRVQGCILHPMRNILFITIVGVFCGHTEHEESGLRDTFALGRGKHALDPGCRLRGVPRAPDQHAITSCQPSKTTLTNFATACLSTSAGSACLFLRKKAASESLPPLFSRKRWCQRLRQRQFLLGVSDFGAVAVG